jgi:hypothetical protein
MVQLKIGKKDEQKEPKDPYAYMDDKELEETEKEVNEEIDPENLKVGDFNFDPKIITEFRDEYPDKNIIYHNSLTKQFLEFYIKHADKVEQLERITFRILEDGQKEMITDAIEEFQMVEGIKEVKEEEKDEEKERKVIDIQTEEQREMYEFILDQKYDEREKGIQNLDNIIREALKERGDINSLESALLYLIDTFDLDKKWQQYIAKETEKVQRTEEKGTPKYIRGSINYFHKLEFLYEFMSKAMVFKDEYEVSDEEIDRIKEIKHLIKKGDN